MLAEYKIIMDDLLDYLIDGNHDGTVAPMYNVGKFTAISMNNTKFQFVRKQEHADGLPKNTVPVLVITQPDQYLNGRVLYKKHYKTLREMLVNEENKQPTIRFFVIPQIIGIQGHNLGDINFDLKIDFEADFDKFGFFSKEIDTILKRHYFKRHMGDYYNIDSPHYGQLYFVPTTSRVINQESLLNRIAQSFNVKFCSLV